MGNFGWQRFWEDQIGRREWIVERAMSGRARRIAIAAPTAADVRDVCIEGESGILNCSPAWGMPVYEPSKRRVTWGNGCVATTFGADRVDALRGPQFDTVWWDEVASWRRPQTFDMIMFGLRLNDALGGGPQACITTTPRPTALIRSLLTEAGTVGHVARAMKIGKISRRVFSPVSLRNMRARGLAARN